MGGKTPEEKLREKRENELLGKTPLPPDAVDDAASVEKKRRAMMVAFKDPGQVNAPRGVPKAVGALPSPLPPMGGILGVK